MSVDLDKNINGTWKLISYELKIDNEISYPFGENPLGFLSYNESGYMNAIISRRDRNKISTLDIYNISKMEKSSLADGFIGYSGKFKIFDDKIVHYVEVSFIPNWIGMSFERFYQFNNGNLILETPLEEIDGKKFISQIIWEKI
jgi:hypothetical protein